MIIDLSHWRREGQPRIYPDVAPTLTARDYKEPRLTIEGDDMKGFAIRGRYNEDGKTEQQAEFRKDDVTSTLTGVQKDNMLLEYGGQYMKTLKVNDLFCGAGGMGIGFKQAGFETAGAWDFDKYAVQAYSHNVDSVVKQADITQMNWDDMPQADVWTFGFPCQDLSIAGKQAGLFEGKRSGLFFEVMRLLDEGIESDIDSLPSIIMAENVKGLKPYLNVLEDEYKKRGYKMYYTLYNSKFWGLAQNRERYFVVGVHESIEKEFKFPVQQEDYIPRLSAFLDPVVDEKYYIDDLKALKIIEQAKEGLKVKQATKKGYDIAVEGDAINVAHPDSKTRRGRVGKQVVQTLLTGQEQIVVETVKASVEKTRPNEEIGIKVFDNGNIRPHRMDDRKSGISEMQVTYERNTAPTVISSHAHKVYGETTNYRVRKLTEREYLRLQGFPEGFEIVCSASQTYKQAGNAVSVPVARAIAERIKMFLLSL
jgi:DNA (cytosine-5)-methyltransferase 1